MPGLNRTIPPLSLSTANVPLTTDRNSRKKTSEPEYPSSVGRFKLISSRDSSHPKRFYSWFSNLIGLLNAFLTAINVWFVKIPSSSSSFLLTMHVNDPFFIILSHSLQASCNSGPCSSQNEECSNSASLILMSRGILRFLAIANGDVLDDVVLLRYLLCCSIDNDSLPTQNNSTNQCE